MPKSFRCHFCGYVAHGETEEELVQDIAKHNKEVHGMELTDEVRKIVHDEMQEEGDVPVGARR